MNLKKKLQNQVTIYTVIFKFNYTHIFFFYLVLLKKNLDIDTF